MNIFKIKLFIEECVRNELQTENLQLNPNQLKQDVTDLVNKLVLDRGLSSVHRERTSGDMNPKDFTEELIRDILSSIEKWTQTVNNKGNRENQPNMIK